MSTALLLAEPELDTRVFLERHLKNDGFRVVDGQAQPDLVLLGDTDALDECRAAHGNVPVIVLGVNVISVIGFVLSMVLGMWLLWGVVRSGRL